MQTELSTNKRTVWVVYTIRVLQNPYGNTAFEWMREAGDECNFQVKIVFEEQLSFYLDKHSPIFIINGVITETPDAVLMRCYHFEFSAFMEKLGIPVLNNTSSMRCCRNKWQTYLALSQMNITQPKSMLISESTCFSDVQQQLGADNIVLKELEGSQGEGVYKVENAAMFDAVRSSMQGDLLAQELIEMSFGKDIRVYTVGEDVVGCVKRVNSKNFKSNFAQGASAYYFETTEEIKEIAKECRAAIGYDFAGIDLLFSDQGLSVCEVNGNAGFRTITAVSTIDLPRLMFAHLAKILT